MPEAASSRQRELTFLHFNDVYHIGPTSCVTRFAARLKELRAQHPDSLTVFSGDAFAPSVEATLLRGQHMVPVLNALGVDIAAFGNHEFDFGEPVAMALSKACTFPWLLSNVEGEAGRTIGGAAQSWTVDRNGVRIGFFALAGTDWPSNCQNFPHDIRFLDPIAVAARMVSQLRGPGGADIVIALTHMRLPEDQLVLAACPGIDLVLGGHDHAPVVINDPAAASPCLIVKSGMDFQQFSVVRMRVDRETQPAVTVTVEEHTGFDDTSLAEDPDMKIIVEKVASQMNTLLDRNLMQSDIALEGRAMVVRTEESNLGNLFADTLRAYYQCDIALVNSGSMRCNRIIPSGVVTIRDMFGLHSAERTLSYSALPFCNIFVTRRVPGASLLQALENSVGDSRTDGRFLQLSGVSVTVDLSRPQGHRVLTVVFTGDDSMKDAPLDPRRIYHVAMTTFVADGYDGYNVFAGTEPVVGSEAGVSETDMLMQVFLPQGGDSFGEHEHPYKAREAVVVRTDEGLPVVRPAVEGRIVFV
ncbi:hypothetical protein HDU88_008402 [Geranomyces variabilis]|nr:hypothetical protein HDU88_008402 [Geranomyces variabilis]